MRLKDFGDHLSSTEEYWRLFTKCPKSVGDLFGDVYKVVDTLWECPNISEDQ
jgi:hypothetical protein